MNSSGFLPSHLGLDQIFAIFENIDHPVYVCDPHTHEVLYANRVIRQELGTVEGRKCFSALQGRDAPCDYCTNPRIFGEFIGRTHVWEHCNPANNRWYRCYDKAIPWPDGRMVRYEMAIDITDSRLNEEALARSEEYYRTLADAAEDFIFIIGRDFKVDFVNQMGAGLFRCPVAELKGKELSSLFPAATAERLVGSVRNVFETGQARNVEGEIQVKDKTLWLETKLVPLRSASGDPQAVLGISRDATARRAGEVALKESEEMFRSVAEQSPNMVFVTKNGRSVYANRRCEEITEYSRVELCSPDYNFLTLPAPEYRDAVRANFERHQQGDDIPPFEFVILSKSGRRIDALYTSRLIQHGGEPAILGTVIDISDQKIAARERERMQAQLVESQKMEAVGTLAGGIAHDFNNMITGIRGFAQLGMADLDQSHPLHADLKQIEAITTRAANLTRQLLLFSRRQPIELRTFSVNDTADNLEKMLRRLIGENIAITPHLSPDLWPVHADEGKVEQVLLNLAINARDAMPEGGSLTITTANCNLDETEASRMVGGRPGKFVSVAVVDTGEGIAQDDLHRIFEPFYTTKEPTKGTGLGLSVVYGIVKQHHGWVTVESALAKGSTFTVFLPACADPSPVSPPNVQPEAPPAPRIQGAARILLVEDEKIVREFGVRSLLSKGYRVIAAENSEDALRLFEENHGAFDLLFSDVVLPGHNGAWLAEELRSRKPGLRILLTSGYMQDSSLWQSIREKDIPFLQKPFGSAELLNAIATRLTQE